MSTISLNHRSSNWPFIRQCAGWAVAMGVGAAMALLWAGSPARPEKTSPPTDLASAIAAWGRPAAGPLVLAAGQPENASAQLQAEASPQKLFQQAIVDAENRPLDPYNLLLKAARDDPRFRSELLTRFAKEKDEAVRGRLGTLLAHTGTADVERFMLNLIQDPNPETRLRGLQVLGGLQAKYPDARKALINALSSENDPAAISIVIGNLGPNEFRSAQEVASMVSRLGAFTQHDNPQVRSSAIASLARWDGAAAEPAIVQGLKDADPRVVEVSVYALYESRLKTEPTKEMLFQLAARPDLPDPVRQLAVGVLGNFNLAGRDFDRVMQLKKELEAAANGAASS